MGLYQKLPDDLTEVDVIIAGGGTAACIVASRLAQADPALRILVIEGGTNNFNVEKVIYPAFFLENLAPNSNSAIFYQGNKAPQLNGRAPIVPSGGILGGGSSINFMMYTRAQPSDYDSWKTPGWTATDLIPFAKKLETYQGYGPEDAHGTTGPIGVTFDTHRSPRIQDDLIAAASKVGYPEHRDMNDFKSNNGFSCYGRYVGMDGRRSDVAHRYLHPLLKDGKHPNLHVLVEHKVLRVLLDSNNRAVGVEFVGNPAFASGTAPTKPTKLRVTATKLVVVSCGALGSPGVLERSGIGSAAVLTKAGVPVLVDLPGVGHDYQDHHLVMLPYKTNLEPHETHDAVMTGKVDRAAAISANDSRLSWNTIDAAGKVRMTDEEVASLGPEFQAMWDRDFKNHPDRPIMLMAVVAMFLGDYAAVPDAQYITLGNYTAYPYSRGHIHITGPELEDPLDFDTGFFSDEHDIDLKKQLWAYKKLREIARRMNLYRGEVGLGHPVFPAGSKAAIHDGPLEADSLENIEYSAEDDKAIEHFLRNSVETTWHSLGTVKMAPREEKGAVDKDLNVYGTTALKVVDLSIPPENVAANTNNTALIIGEKGADIIAKELGITLA